MIKYFRKLLLVLQSIDKRLEHLEGCIRDPSGYSTSERTCLRTQKYDN